MGIEKQVYETLLPYVNAGKDVPRDVARECCIALANWLLKSRSSQSIDQPDEQTIVEHIWRLFDQFQSPTIGNRSPSAEARAKTKAKEVYDRLRPYLCVPKQESAQPGGVCENAEIAAAVVYGKHNVGMSVNMYAFTKALEFYEASRPKREPAQPDECRTDTTAPVTDAELNAFKKRLMATLLDDDREDAVFIARILTRLRLAEEKATVRESSDPVAALKCAVKQIDDEYDQIDAAQHSQIRAMAGHIIAMLEDE